MAIRGAARAVARAARCGSAGLRPAAPAASATRVAAVFILHGTCACDASSGLLSGSVSSNCSPVAQRCRPILLSVMALRRAATICNSIAAASSSIVFVVDGTSDDCFQDAGADHKAALL